MNGGGGLRFDFFVSTDAILYVDLLKILINFLDSSLSIILHTSPL